MSDIKVGDLVIVVKPTVCCGNKKRLGQIFKTTAYIVSTCLYCKETQSGFCSDTNFAVEYSRLKRIPPLSELEGQRTEEKLKEPA